MADTCGCEYCGLSRERNARRNARIQQTSWFERNSAPWNLVKLTLFVIVLSLITVCATPLVILAGGFHGCISGRGIGSGLVSYTILWKSFTWKFGKKFLINWCPTCSNRCLIGNTKRLALKVLEKVIITRSAAVHPLDPNMEAPELPPPPADQACDICATENVQGRIWDSWRFEDCGHGFHSRCLMHRLVQHDTCPVCIFNNGRLLMPRLVEIQDGAPPPPPEADQPCTICTRENVQGNNLRTWESWRFETCGHGYHSRCLMLKLLEHDQCPVCTFDNRHLVGNPRGPPGPLVPGPECSVL